MSDKKPTWQRLLQTFAILAILVIFPIGSWYFLQKGFDYTKDKYEKLDSLGQVRYDTLLLKDSTLFSTSAMEEHLTLAGNLHQADSAELAVIQGLWKKFDDRKDFYFLFYDKGTTDFSTDDLLGRYEFWKDTEQVKIAGSAALTESEFFRILGLQKPLKNNELILVDPNLRARGRYNILSPEERDLMISHIVFLLPKE